MKETRNVQFKVLPKYGIEATEKGTSIMAAWIGSVQQGIKDIEEKVALSMHLSRVLYISKLPLVKSKATLAEEEASTRSQSPPETRATLEDPPVPAPERQQWLPVAPVPAVPAPRIKMAAPTQAATPSKVHSNGNCHTLTTPAVTGGNGYVPVQEAKPKVAKPTPKPKEEKPPQAMTVTVTRFSTWEEEEPQRIRLDLMSNSKVSELRSKLAELCVLDDKEVRKMKLIKRKKAGFLTAQETENVSNEIFVHHIDKWPSA